MRVMTLLGTRPEIIRLSLIIKSLDSLCEQIIVYTGQNSDPLLSDTFFRELQLRHPDLHLKVDARTFHDQAAQIIARAGAAFLEARPDRLLILGDTNSGLAAIPAARLGLPVFHMEAGNRCYDDRVPEEVNRRIIDHSSTILMPYTLRSKENLLREGIERERIFVIGNPIYQVLTALETPIRASDVLQRLEIENGGYFLATIHRAENVDEHERLAQLVNGLAAVGDRYDCPVLVSVHPRTWSMLERFGVSPPSSRVRLLKPLGLIDFVALERHARAVLSDSGTVQEECAIFGVPNVTLRDVTERPETIECGSNILSGVEPGSIVEALTVALAAPPRWSPPSEYLVPDVVSTVTKIVLGRLCVRRHGMVCPRPTTG